MDAIGAPGAGGALPAPIPETGRHTRGRKTRIEM